MQIADKKNISVVIVNYNSGNLLAESLKNVLGKNSGREIEVVVVDNASNDSSLSHAEKSFPQVNFIKNNKNIGFSKAVNQGIKVIRGDFILLLNPDTIIDIDVLWKMAAFLDNQKNSGIVGPKLLNLDGTVQLSCRSFPSFINALFNRYSPFTRIFPKNKYSAKYLYTDWNHDRPREVDWVSGACMLIKNDMLRQIGPLDEDYFMYCEDIDLCYRAKKANWNVYYCPDASAKHLIRSGKKRATLKSIADHHVSMYKFFKKHYNKNSFLKNLTTSLFLVTSFFFMITYKKLMRAN